MEIAVWHGRNAGKEISPTDGENDQEVVSVQLEVQDARVISLEAELATTANNQL